MEAGAIILPQIKIAILGSQGCGKKEYIKSIVSKQIESIQDYIN
jgi:signal recognition particle receptor subunit beta